MVQSNPVDNLAPPSRGDAPTLENKKNEARGQPANKYVSISYGGGKDCSKPRG